MFVRSYNAESNCANSSVTMQYWEPNYCYNEYCMCDGGYFCYNTECTGTPPPTALPTPPPTVPTANSTFGYYVFAEYDNGNYTCRASPYYVETYVTGECYYDATRGQDVFNVYNAESSQVVTIL